MTSVKAAAARKTIGRTSAGAFGVVVASLWLAVAATDPVRAATKSRMVLVSATAEGAAGDGISLEPSVSSNGRYVAFSSRAANIAPVAGAAGFGVYLLDTKRSTLQNVPAGIDGGPESGESYRPVISSDGRHVAFVSDVASGDLGTLGQVFLREVARARTTLVSVDSSGEAATAESGNPSVCAGGRLIAFDSFANNLVSGDMNGASDVFVRDPRARTTVRASVGRTRVDADGDSLRATISENGRLLAFESTATNLVAGDTNGYSDVFVRDLKRSTTRRISLGLGGTEANGDSSGAVISGNGRYVAFLSLATNLVDMDTNGQTDVFVVDLKTSRVERVSVSDADDEPNSFSGAAAISRTGRVVSFMSYASNLVPSDTNAALDVLRRDRARRRTTRVSLHADGTELAGPSFSSAVTADGRVAFVSSQPVIPTADSNGTLDVYLSR